MTERMAKAIRALLAARTPVTFLNLMREGFTVPEVDGHRADAWRMVRRETSNA